VRQNLRQIQVATANISVMRKMQNFWNTHFIPPLPPKKKREKNPKISGYRRTFSSYRDINLQTKLEVVLVFCDKISDRFMLAYGFRGFSPHHLGRTSWWWDQAPHTVCS
jgi:hypothetical protein